MRRKRWLNIDRAINAVISDAAQQGAHVAYHQGLYKVNRGSRGSAVGQDLLHLCKVNGYKYCGFYNHLIYIDDLREDLDYVREEA